MKTTHTNGKWEIIEQVSGQLWIFSNTPTGLDSICQITPATSITAISPDNKLGIRKSDEVDANAKLIASAPELLKALESSIRLNESMVCFLSKKETQDSALKNIAELKEAIKKATK